MSDRRLRSPTLYPIELRALTLADASADLKSASNAHEIPTTQNQSFDPSTRVGAQEKLTALSAAGVVYFVRAKRGGGPIKIGHTTNLKSRMAGMSCGSPVALAVVATTPGGEEIERRLHEKLASIRMRGEWFAPAWPLLRLVERLRRAIVDELREALTADFLRGPAVTRRYGLRALRNIGLVPDRRSDR